MRRETTDKWHPPDGGFGWMVVYASFIICFVIYGQIYAWGVYQSEFVEEKFGSESQIALLGSIANAILQIGSLIVKPFVNTFGIRGAMLFGSIFLVSGIFLASLVSEIWQLCLFQGFFFGIGGALVFIPSLTVPALWFLQLRGLAFGIIGSGSGVGGFLLAPAIRFLISKVGLRTTLKIHAAFSLVMLISAIPFIKIPPELEKDKKQEDSRATFSYAFLKRKTVLLYMTICFLMPFGFATPFYYLPWLSDFDGSILLSIMSGVSAISHVLVGVAADLIGTTKTLTATLFLQSICCMVIWPLAKSYYMLVVFTVLYGLVGGSYTILRPVVVAELARMCSYRANCAIGPEELMDMMTIVVATNVIGHLLGPPISGFLVDVTVPNTSYLYTQLFCGFIKGSGCFFALLMHLCDEKK